MQGVTQGKTVYNMGDNLHQCAKSKHALITNVTYIISIRTLLYVKSFA